MVVTPLPLDILPYSSLFQSISAYSSIIQPIQPIPAFPGLADFNGRTPDQGCWHRVQSLVVTPLPLDILPYSSLFQHIPAYPSLFQHIQACMGMEF